MSDLWSITSYFNPRGYRRRLHNYQVFRRALPTPLATVELSFTGEFELGEDDAEILLRVSGQDVMWQKERLLNVALEALPDECEHVAWLDCDVLFAESDWVERTREQLERFALLQPFHTVHYLSRDWAKNRDPREFVERSRPSLASGVMSGMPAGACLVYPSPDQHPGTYSPGMAWAGRRELLAHHRLFDANIVGGGDRAIASAAYGCFEHPIERHEMNARRREHYLAWARPFHAACEAGVGSVEGEIYHMWHGDGANRGLKSRHVGFRQFDFDPRRDIGPGPGGCWRWTSDKPRMHAFLRDYFGSRREDG